MPGPDEAVEEEMECVVLLEQPLKPKKVVCLCECVCARARCHTQDTL